MPTCQPQAFGKDTTKSLEKKAKSIADKAHFVGTDSVAVLQSLLLELGLSLGGVVTHQVSSFMLAVKSCPQAFHDLSVPLMKICVFVKAQDKQSQCHFTNQITIKTRIIIVDTHFYHNQYTQIHPTTSNYYSTVIFLGIARGSQQPQQCPEEETKAKAAEQLLETKKSQKGRLSVSDILYLKDLCMYQ